MLDQTLTADDIFAADDTTLKPLTIPEWTKNGKPGVLWFKVMTADESFRFNDMMKMDATKREAVIRLLSQCACDENGNLLFKSSDLEKLRKKNISIFLRMQKFLLQLNGMMSPDKSWKTVQSILQDCGIDSNVIALVKGKWDAADTDEMVNALKND
jgi:hypothetical protein